MPRNRQTTEELLAWAKGQCYVEIFVDGSAEVQMFDNMRDLSDDFEIRYSDHTLRKTILRAQRGEKKRIEQ